MMLVGLQVKIDGEPRFVGKVGNGIRPFQVKGSIILFRSFKNMYSTATESISIDARAVVTAIRMGAEYAVCHDQESDATFIAKLSKIAQAPAVDLGEDPQFRLHVNEWDRRDGIDADPGYAAIVQDITNVKIEEEPDDRPRLKQIGIPGLDEIIRKTEQENAKERARRQNARNSFWR